MQQSPFGYFAFKLFVFYNGVYLVALKLFIYDVIVSQKGSNGDRKLHFFGWGYILLTLSAQKSNSLYKVTFVLRTVKRIPLTLTFSYFLLASLISRLAPLCHHRSGLSMGTDTKEQSVRVIKCHFERSKMRCFLKSVIYSIVRKGHKGNPE